MENTEIEKGKGDKGREVDREREREKEREMGSDAKSQKHTRKNNATQHKKK